MSEFLHILPNAEQQERIARALERIADLQAAIAAGTAGADFIDATFGSLLDGTNTTTILRQWWAMAAGDTPDKYERLSRFANMAAQAWDGKVYTVRGYSSATADHAMTPLDDLAGKGKAVLATDTTPGGADWAEEDPMTWYIRANAVSKADGTMDIKALEGEEGFDITGESAPVYTFALALWRREIRDASYTTKSWRTTPAAGFRPYAGDVAPDGTKRALTWHPTFDGALNSKGNLTSGAGRPVANFTSASAGLTAARKWNAYEGLWCDCDTEWLLDMWQLRHQDKENSGILEGCTTYNHQFQVAVAENGVTRVLVTTAQGANFVEGSTVSVGDHGSNSNRDRGQADMRNLADKVQITSIATVQVGAASYTALNLDLGGKTIDVPAEAWVSTMPWHTGSTERVPGHKDGCRGSLTNGKYPMRVAGVEALVGAYAIGLDPLYNVKAGSDSTHWTYDRVAVCRDSEKLGATIGAGYVDTGITFTDMPQGWQYVKEFAQNDDGVVFPSEISGSSTQWYKSAFCGSYSAGVRCPWRFANLNNGGNAGLAGENGNNSPTTANWNGSPRLSHGGETVSESPRRRLKKSKRCNIPAFAKIM